MNVSSTIQAILSQWFQSFHEKEDDVEQQLIAIGDRSIISPDCLKLLLHACHTL
jgi:hypothetical protein